MNGTSTVAGVVSVAGVAGAGWRGMVSILAGIVTGEVPMNVSAAVAGAVSFVWCGMVPVPAGGVWGGRR